MIIKRRVFSNAVKHLAGIFNVWIIHILTTRGVICSTFDLSFKLQKLFDVCCLFLLHFCSILNIMRLSFVHFLVCSESDYPQTSKVAEWGKLECVPSLFSLLLFPKATQNESVLRNTQISPPLIQNWTFSARSLYDYQMKITSSSLKATKARRAPETTGKEGRLSLRRFESQWTRGSLFSVTAERKEKFIQSLGFWGGFVIWATSYVERLYLWKEEVQGWWQFFY